jgi:hypothetical protein
VKNQAKIDGSITLKAKKGFGLNTNEMTVKLLYFLSSPSRSQIDPNAPLNMCS